MPAHAQTATDNATKLGIRLSAPNTGVTGNKLKATVRITNNFAQPMSSAFTTIVVDKSAYKVGNAVSSTPGALCSHDGKTIVTSVCRVDQLAPGASTTMTLTLIPQVPGSPPVKGWAQGSVQGLASVVLTSHLQVTVAVS